MNDAARLQFSTEKIGSEVTVPSVIFSNKGDKSFVTIILGFKTIANAADSSTSADPDVYADGTYGSNLVAPSKATVRFEKLGTQGESKIYIEASLGTKIPGTGALRKETKDKI